MVYVLQPNNPTGQLINPQDFRTLLELTRGKAIVVADEAYIEFARRHRWLAGWRNIRTRLFCAHCRSFAWRAFVAGLRWQNEELINLLMKVIAPYLSLDAGCRHCGPGVKPGGSSPCANGWRNYCRTRIPDCRPERDLLRGAGFDSETNYILARFKASSAVFKSLWDQGIIFT